MRRIGVSVLAAAILAAPLAVGGAGMASAQQALPALSQTLDYDGRWAIDYPGAWVVDLTGFPVIASMRGAVATLILNDPLPEGTMVIGIIPPEAVEMIGVGPGVPLEEAAARVAAFYGTTDAAVAPFETVAGPAVVAPLTASPRLPGGSTIIVVDHEAGTFVFLVVVGNFGGATPLLQAMLETLR